MISKRLHPASFSNVNAQLAQITTDTYGNKTNDAISSFILNGDFGSTENWTGSMGTLSASGNTLSITGTGGNSAVQAIQTSTIPVAVGKKVYVKAKVRVTNAVCSSIQLVVDGSSAGANQATQLSSPRQNEWYELSALHTQPADVSGYVQIKIAQIYADAATANGKVLEIKYVVAVDATSKYGAGNEPSVSYFDKTLLLTSNNWFSGTLNTLSLFSDTVIGKYKAYWQTNRVTFIQKQTQYKWLGFVYELKTSAAVNLNCWRLSEVFIYDCSTPTAYMLNPNSSDIEGVIKISGEANFLGSVHGNEQLVNVYLYLDGKPQDVTVSFSGSYSTVEFVVESTVYRYDGVTQGFTHYKSTVFDNDGVHVNNRWKALASFTLDRVRLPVNAPKYSDASKLFETYKDTVMNVKPVAVPAVSGSQSDLVYDTTLVDTEINGNIASVKSWVTNRGGTASSGLITDFGDRLKIYFDCYVGESVALNNYAYARYDYKYSTP